MSDPMTGLIRTLHAMTRDVTDVQRRVSRLETLETSAITPEAWHNVTYQNSWVDYGLGNAGAGYWKDVFGIVHLRGAVKSGTIGAGIFTLPTGYRPPFNCSFTVTSGTSPTLGRVDITTAGSVTAAVGSNTFFPLDGITFRV
jgi:hypothetical protein